MKQVYTAGSDYTLTEEERARLFYVDGSQRVRRWHTEPVLHNQTVGEHSYGVMYLVLELTGWSASRNLLLASLMHDTAERKTGDVPGPTKRKLGVKAAFDAMEDAHMAELGLVIPALTESEAFTLKLADNLEGAMFCAFELRRGNRDIRPCFVNYLNYTAGLLVNEPRGLAWRIYNELYKDYTNVFG